MTNKTSKTSGLLPAPLRDEFGQAVLTWFTNLLPMYADTSENSCWKEPPAFEWDRGCAIRLQPAAPGMMFLKFKTAKKVRTRLFKIARRLLELSSEKHQRTLRQLAEQEGC